MRSRTRWATLALTAVLFPAPSIAADGTAADRERTAVELRQRALADNQAFETLRSLVVEVGPRFAGSEGDRRAVEWAVAKMKQQGFDDVRTEPVTVPRWVRGEAAGEILEPFPQEVVLIALGGSIATPAEGLTAEVVEVASLADLAERSREEIEGKLVFINQRMRRARSGSGYGQTVGIRTQGAARAAEKGAVGVIIRSVGTDNDRIAHTGTMRYAEGVPKIPAAALSNPDADLLAAQMEYGKPVRFRLLLDTKRLPDAESANVIGEIRGREKPEEIVLLAAHLDSWDVGQGAHDDGSGCAIVMEAARLIGEMPQRPRRTIRVVLFANEEFGLSGARRYAEVHADEADLHVAAVEADFGAGAPWLFRSRVDPSRMAGVNVMARVLGPLGIERGDNQARGGADLSPLRPLGVPVFDIVPDGTFYFDLHHTDNDTLDKVDPEALSRNVAAYTAFAYLAAEQPGDFGRGPQ